MSAEFPINGILRLLKGQENFVFLESAKCDAENFLSFLFLEPKKIIATFKMDEINACFAELDKTLKKGFYAAGFLAYEAGEAFEERLRHRERYDFPLLWFGIYPQPLIYHHQKKRFIQGQLKTIKKVWVNQKNTKQGDYRLKNIRANITQNSYLRAIAKIKALIARGFTYQVNYTFKLNFTFSGSPAGLYLNLRNNQAVPYSGLLKAGTNYILSFSPELFFRKKGRIILARPMKGTAQRGRNLKEDDEVALKLKHCLKNRSENIMIVDLLRNDLGKISKPGSVAAPQLFNVEKYATLLQMTSDIQGRLDSSEIAFDIFRYIFPSGSVTGAPKIKTMEIIRNLEKEPRNIYTGSIGFFAPDKSATFNVAIRTLLIDSKNKSGEMGVGSGIVYDSSGKQEFAECCLKANFLTKSLADFKLLETLLWQPLKGYWLLDEHLKRLKASARYFNFRYNQKEIQTALARLQKGFQQNDYKVRLLLDKYGNIQLESSLFSAKTAQTPKVTFSTKKTLIQNPFLYHKTTNRRLYDEEYKHCQRLGFYDVIFTNEKREITEGAISNIFIKKNGALYTPPLSCGLLDGVYRRHLLTSRPAIQEKVLFKKDLFEAEEIYLSNSVRGLVKVELAAKNH